LLYWHWVLRYYSEAQCGDDVAEYKTLPPTVGSQEEKKGRRRRRRRRSRSRRRK
jgi:hypothetical protein